MKDAIRAKERRHEEVGRIRKAGRERHLYASKHRGKERGSN